MHLKSLELHGFKSFAERTVFEFHEGVTGIVGPNGCGKSNVVDAVRWVLGETSAKALRGGEMADVIFSGTDKRKALGMAEVTLTMAGCEGILKMDYDEVSITFRPMKGVAHASGNKIVVSAEWVTKKAPNDYGMIDGFMPCGLCSNSSEKPASSNLI